MKKLLIIPVILASSICVAQSLPDNKTVAAQKADYIEAATKVLKYEILVKEENKNIFKSSFEVKNGSEFIVLSKEIGIQNRGLNQKTGVLNQQEIMSTIDMSEKQAGDIDQLKVTANIGKDNNIFSEFSWKTINLSSTKKSALLSQENKAAIIETIPIMNSTDSKILLTHTKNNEAFFTIDKKEFTIKAVY